VHDLAAEGAFLFVRHVKPPAKIGQRSGAKIAKIPKIAKILKIAKIPKIAKILKIAKIAKIPRSNEAIRRSKVRRTPVCRSLLAYRKNARPAGDESW
jgi:hypothetical protein